MAAADYRLMTEATGQRIAAALEALSGFGAYLTTTDVINNLTSTATNKPLSAAQGKALNDMITGISAVTITGSAVTLTANNLFDISFSVSRTGYTAIAVTGYNLNDRAVADKLGVSGTVLESNNITAHIYGKCGAADVSLAGPSVTVLYKKST